MNDYNERSTWRRMRALLSINDPRWGRGGNGDKPRANESKRPNGRDDGPRISTKCGGTSTVA
ncbi:hypothetical protein BMMON3_41100 [Burkholderia mallei]